MIDIRPASDSDKGQILERIADTFGDEQAQRAERRWDWQWRLDPRLDEPGYKGVVAEWRGRIIGSVSCLPAGLYIGGKPAEAKWLVDMLVSWSLMRQAMREQKRSGKGPDLSDGIAAAMLGDPAAGPIQLAKHIAEPMMAIILRIGWAPKEHTANMTRRVSLRWPLQKALGKPMGSLVAAGANLALPGIPQGGPHVKRLDGRFDSRFDHLWDRARETYSAITLRDTRTLNWHYRDHPDTAYEVLTLEQNGTLLGYAVYKVFERKGRLLARIVDVLADRDDSESLAALLAGALRHIRKEGVERVECFACGTGLTRSLERLHFVQKLTKSGKVQPLMKNHLPDLDIYVTRGDGDGG